MPKVFIDDYIAPSGYESFGYITPRSIREKLKEYGGEDIELEINSGGGSIFAAFEIINILNSYSGNVSATITGQAASAAAEIYLSIDKENRKVYKKAQIMFHRATGGALGNSDEISSYGTALRDLEKIIAASIAAAAEISQKKALDKMNENWYITGGENIKNAGFASIVFDKTLDEDKKDEKKVKNQEKVLDKNGKTVIFDNIEAAISLSKEMKRPSNIDKLKNMMRPLRNKGPKNKEEIVDIETLKNEHPEIIEAIKNEARAEIDKELAAKEQADKAKAEITSQIKSAVEEAVAKLNVSKNLGLSANNSAAIGGVGSNGQAAAPKKEPSDMTPLEQAAILFPKKEDD